MLRAAKPRRPVERKLLIVSMSDFLYQLKLEGVLGKALQLDGYEPIVLTLRESEWARPYLHGFGFSQFVYPDEFELADTSEADEAASRFLSVPVTVQTLKALEFHGAFVGQQTLSSISRRFERGRISLDDPEVRKLLDQLLPESMHAVLRAEAMLDAVRPDAVLFNEKGYESFGAIYDVAVGRGLNVIQFVAAGIHWRDALLFKRYTEETRRLHPASLSAASWERVRAMPWTAKEDAELDEEFSLRYDSGAKHPDAGLQQGKQQKSAEVVRAQLGLDPGKKTAVIFSHVLWDANLFYGEDLFEDQETWLVETVRAACANPEVDWVVKLHPANLYKAARELNDKIAIRERVGELPAHVKLLEPDTDLNTFSLFSVADYGITIRGTVGMELPCFGAPVLTAGTGRYSGFGFTIDSATAAEYLDRLARIQEIPPLSAEETELARRHAYGLFRLRPFRFTSYEASFMPPDKLGHPLSHNLRLTLRSAAEVERASDLRAFAEWAEDPTLLDYLAPLT